MPRRFRHLSFGICAGMFVALVASAVIAAPPVEDYAAPFGHVGTASASNPPSFSVGTPPADTVNEVVITPMGPVPAPPTPVTIPPSRPKQPDTGLLVHQASFDLCQQMIPAVRDGFYEYIGDDPARVDAFALEFVVAGPTGVDIAIMQRCMKDGYMPPESHLQTCESCQRIVTNIHDGFYTSTPPVVGTDSDGNPIYDFTGVSPKWVRSCLMIGHWPKEWADGPGFIKTCSDADPLPSQIPPNYCAPRANFSWSVRGNMCEGGIGSGAEGTEGTVFSSKGAANTALEGNAGYAKVICQGGQWTFTEDRSQNTCGKPTIGGDKCKPGTYTFFAKQLMRNGVDYVENKCEATFPTGKDGEVIYRSFPHLYWPPPYDAWTSGEGNFVCDVSTLEGDPDCVPNYAVPVCPGISTTGGWVAQSGFKCIRPDM